MRWRRTGRGNIEDRRGQGFGRALPIGGVGGGLGLVILLVTLLLRGGGVDVGQALEGLDAQADQDQEGPATPDPDRDLVDFLNFVVGDVQLEWREIFREAGQTYENTVLVLFEHTTNTACGTGSAATGPFYCPADGKMYLDLGFFRELHDRFGAPGDFAQAYVIAHEAGHHVQNLLGVDEQVRAERSRSEDPNELSIRQELQADCFAGVWAFTAFDEQLLESGDLEEGLDAAAAVGDDRIQRSTTGRVNQETWTHGSSAQRMEWFRRGFDSGSPDRCDTFSADV